MSRFDVSLKWRHMGADAYQITNNGRFGLQFVHVNNEPSIKARVIGSLWEDLQWPIDSLIKSH